MRTLSLSEKQRCEQWSRANKSDPFAEATAICHYRNGIAGEKISSHQSVKKPPHYSAKKEVNFETIEVHGREIEFPVVTWKDLCRP